MIVSYSSILIDWGFKKVSAKQIVQNRNDKAKLSEIISSILFAQFSLALFAIFIYITIILSVPSYRQHFLLLFFSFGLVFNDLLFPQYYFQGLEKNGIHNNSEHYYTKYFHYSNICGYKRAIRLHLCTTNSNYRNDYWW